MVNFDSTLIKHKQGEGSEACHDKLLRDTIRNRS